MLIGLVAEEGEERESHSKVGTLLGPTTIITLTFIWQVRVVQGKEPTHFTAMFGGKMTVFQVRPPLIAFHQQCLSHVETSAVWIYLEPLPTQGGHASSFDGEGGQDVGIPQYYLLQVGNHAGDDFWG